MPMGFCNMYLHEFILCCRVSANDTAVILNDTVLMNNNRTCTVATDTRLSHGSSCPTEDMRLSWPKHVVGQQVAVGLSRS